MNYSRHAYAGGIDIGHGKVRCCRGSTITSKTAMTDYTCAAVTCRSAMCNMTTRFPGSTRRRPTRPEKGAVI